MLGEYGICVNTVSDTAVSEQAGSDGDQVASVGQPDETASALDTRIEQPQAQQRKQMYHTVQPGNAVQG